MHKLNQFEERAHGKLTLRESEQLARQMGLIVEDDLETGGFQVFERTSSWSYGAAVFYAFPDSQTVYVES